MTSWKSEFYCSNSDVIFLVTSSSLHKNQLVDKNLPFLINDNACIWSNIFLDFFQPLASTVASERSKMNLTESDQKLAQMILNHMHIDMVIVSINTGNHTISLNKHTIGLEIYNSTCQYTFKPMCNAGVISKKIFEISSPLINQTL